MKIYKVEWCPTGGYVGGGFISSTSNYIPSTCKYFTTKEKADDLLKQLTQASLLLGTHSHSAKVLELEVEE